MLGGAFLCFEGFEKLAHGFLHREEVDAHRSELAQAVADPEIDLMALEKDKIKGAIRTDFILSAEIIVIALGTVATQTFGLQVTVDAIGDVDQRMEIVRIAESFATNPVVFAGMFEGQQAGLQEAISRAREVLPDVRMSDDLLRLIAETCSNLGIRTHRAEITVARTSRTIAAFNGRWARISTSSGSAAWSCISTKC